MGVRDALLVVQIAICAVLVTSSFVAARGLARSLYANYGFEPRNTMLMNVNLAMAGHAGDKVLDIEKRVIDGMATLSGVEHAGFINRYPPLVYGAGTKMNVFKDETRDLREANAVAKPYRYEVSPGYFAAARTTIVTGRDFTWHDDKDAPRVALVNQTFAVELLGGAFQAIGKSYRLQDGARVQVVGVLEDGKYLSLTEEPQPAMFLSCLQWPSSEGYLVARYKGSETGRIVADTGAERIATNMRHKLREIDPALPPDTESWNSLLDLVLLPSRVATIALGALGGIGAVLAISGIFGMAAYSVSKRLKELGIRMALGAKRTQVLNTALGRAFRLLAIGSVTGLLLGLAATRVLSAIVFQATPRDPLVLAGAIAVMLLLGLIATWMPAQRALSANPGKLLREE